MKTLYTFEVPKEIEVPDTENSKDAQGNDIVITKKVKKNVPQKISIKFPTNTLKDDGNIFYCKIESFLKRQGIDTISDVEKRLLNQGGVLSDPEKKLRETLITDGAEIQEKLNQLLKLKDEELTPEQKEEIKKHTDTITNILTQLQDITNKVNDAYKNTVETIATNKMILFWLLFLSYKEEDGKDKPFFGTGTFEERKSIFDGIDEKEGNEFEKKVIKKLFLVISGWLYGKANTKEEFDAWVLLAENQNVLS